jgi:N-acetylglucosaminyldiphosphoundecaprenol N-acetyl-beta-D-mannosaminyltransferase
MPEQFDVLGVGISAIDPPFVLDRMRRWIETQERHYICVCATHIIMECQNDPELRAMVNRASLAVPDGMPLVWIAHLMGLHNVGRVYGPDLMLSFCQLAAQKGYTNYFLGGATGQPQVLAQRLTDHLPGLPIAGTRSTPNRPLPPEENDLIIKKVNKAHPDVVWVGMGTPYQERWMAENRARLRSPILVGVGAAFDMHSGFVRQAPAWMQQGGLEWLFRLVQEPRRLWRRYLVGNPRFVAKLLGQWLRGRKYTRPIDVKPKDDLIT